MNEEENEGRKEGKRLEFHDRKLGVGWHVPRGHPQAFSHLWIVQVFLPGQFNFTIHHRLPSDPLFSIVLKCCLTLLFLFNFHPVRILSFQQDYKHAECRFCHLESLKAPTVVRLHLPFLVLLHLLPQTNILSPPPFFCKWGNLGSEKFSSVCQRWHVNTDIHNLLLTTEVSHQKSVFLLCTFGL